MKKKKTIQEQIRDAIDILQAEDKYGGNFALISRGFLLTKKKRKNKEEV